LINLKLLMILWGMMQEMTCSKKLQKDY